MAELALGGWNVSGVFSRRAACPSRVTQSGGQIWDGTQRPNLVGDPSTSGPITSRLDNYFNPAAFSQPAPDVPGTTPRTLSYRGPGIQIFDAVADQEHRHSRRAAAGGSNRGPERPQPSGVRRSQHQLRIDVVRSDYQHEGRAAPDDVRTQVPLLIPRVCGGRRMSSRDDSGGLFFRHLHFYAIFTLNVGRVLFFSNAGRVLPLT